MYKSCANQDRIVRFCCLLLLVTFVVVMSLPTQLGETADFPSNDQLPASLHGETHGAKNLRIIRIGNGFVSAAWVHAHALAAAHWDRYGFYRVYAKAYKSPFAPWWRIVTTREDEKVDYFNDGCRAIAVIDDPYALVPVDDVCWLASFRVWDQTDRKGEVNYEGLVYPD